MDSRATIIKCVCAVVALASLGGAAFLQQPLDLQERQCGLKQPTNIPMQSNPWTTLLCVAPGGLRAPILHMLWIRATGPDSKKRTYETLQLADLICTLQPQFAGTWDFLAWNMSYNISVEMTNPQQRWLWVYNGVKLLRDRAIPQNPRSLTLYKDLVNIFMHKMGGYTDDMNYSYKQRWAAYMQRLLAPSPFAEPNEALAEMVEIAQAPLDKDPQIQTLDLIQPAQTAELLKDPGVERVAKLLAAQGVGVDRSLLEACNRWGLQWRYQAIRVNRPHPETPRDRAVSELVNAPDNAKPLAKMLAFVRAQILWNEYRMDPQWMVEMMKTFGPLDWRLVWSHGLYWASYGVHINQGTAVEWLGRLEVLTDYRWLLNCMKELSWGGRMVYIENPEDPDSPDIQWLFDPRFVDYAQAEYLRLIDRIVKERTNPLSRNDFRDGHINYLASAIKMLYAMGRNDQAMKYLQYIRNTYNKHDEYWDFDLPEFVIARTDSEGVPTREEAGNQIGVYVITANLLQAAGNTKESQVKMAQAVRVYNIYQKAYGEGHSFPPFKELEIRQLLELLALPQRCGFNVPLATRASIYQAQSDEFKQVIYPRIASFLQRQCQDEGLLFEKAFPAPAGMTPPAAIIK